MAFHNILFPYTNLSFPVYLLQMVVVPQKEEELPYWCLLSLYTVQVTLLQSAAAAEVTGSSVSFTTVSSVFLYKVIWLYVDLPETFISFELYGSFLLISIAQFLPAY